MRCPRLYAEQLYRICPPTRDEAPGRGGLPRNGRSTQKETDQSEEGKTTHLLQAQTGTRGGMPSLPQRETAPCRLSAVRLLPGPTGSAWLGIARPCRCYPFTHYRLYAPFPGIQGAHRVMSNVQRMQCVVQWDTPGNAVSSATNRRLRAAVNDTFSSQRADFLSLHYFCKIIKIVQKGIPYRFPPQGGS